MTLCNGDECDRYEPGEIVAPVLPVDGGGGGGHEFVDTLPEVGKPGVEYILLDDLLDCSTFEGTFVYNVEQECWTATSGSGGEGGNYTFEPTATGWVAKKNGNVIFTYSDGRIATNATAISNIQGDIYDDYLVDRILVDDDYFKLTIDSTNPNAKTLELGFKDGVELGDKSDGAYKMASGVLTTALGGTTSVAISQITGIVETDIVVGETLIYDIAGTLGVVTSKTSGNVVVTTMTVSPGERAGVRLGTVDTDDDLPATVTDAEALGWQTPLSGDYAYVRDYNDSLAEFLATVVDNDITWTFSHYLNSGDYVVDVYKGDGTLIPKNPDGGVTLPVDNDVASVKLADGTALQPDANRAVTLPDFGEIKGIRTHEGSLLPISSVDKTVTLPQGGGGGDVASVNGQTGVVVLTADDIDADNAQSIQSNIDRIDEETERLEDEKQDKLVAGENIEIDPETNEISASGAQGPRGLRGLTGPEGTADLVYQYDQVTETLTISADDSRKETRVRIIDPRKTSAKGTTTSTYTATGPCKVMPFFMSANSNTEGNSTGTVTYECDDPYPLTEWENATGSASGFSHYENARVYELNTGESITVTGTCASGNTNTTAITAIVVIEEDSSLGDLEYEIVYSNKMSNNAYLTYEHTLQEDDVYLIQLSSAGGGATSAGTLTFSDDNANRRFYGDDTGGYIGPIVPPSSTTMNCVSNNSYAARSGVALFDLRNPDVDEVLTTRQIISSSTKTFHSGVWIVARIKQEGSES